MQSVEQTWARLRENGLVEGALPQQRQEDTAWYVKALLGFSGWFAAVFLLGFLVLGLSGLLESPPARLVVGAGLIALAWLLLRQESNEFFEQAGLAFSLAGQALIGWFLFEVFDENQKVGALLLAGVQVALAAFMPSYVHRVFSSCIAAVSLFFVVRGTLLHGFYLPALLLVVVVVWLNEFRWPTHVRRVQAVGYGLVLALLVMKGSGFGTRALWDEVLNAGVLLFVIWRLLGPRTLASNPQLVATAIGGAALVSVASLQASGLVTGITIMLLGFAGGNRVLLGLGTAALLFYISHYYYALDTTLLTKSISLGAVGAALLLVRAVLLKVFSPGEEAPNA